MAVLALAAVQLLRGAWVPPTRREWLLLAAFGVAWFLIYNLALNAAEHELDPGTAALLVNVAPLIVALVAGSLLGEGFPRWLIIGAVGSLPWSGGLIAQVAAAPPAATAGVVYLGLVPTAIAFLAWAYALQRMPAGRLITTTYLVPVIATIAAWPLLGEVPPPLALLGGLLCLVGVALTRMPTRVRAVPAGEAVGA